MPHQLDTHVAELPSVTEWLSGDDRALIFEVVGADGEPVDISNATVAWTLHERAYEDDPETAVLSGDSSGVELVTDARADPENGVWEVRISGEATEDLWGSYWHRPVVEQPDSSRASWRGKLTITA